MKICKKIFVISVLSLPVLIIVGFFISVFNRNEPRNCTAQILGNGTYNILKQYNSPNIEQYYLKSSFTNETISNNVLKYMVNDKRSLVYVIGKKDINDVDYEYIILNYKTGEFLRYFSLEEMTAKNKLIFIDEEKFEITGEK